MPGSWVGKTRSVVCVGGGVQRGLCEVHGSCALPPSENPPSMWWQPTSDCGDGGFSLGSSDSGVSPGREGPQGELAAWLAQSFDAQQ